jgi:hypothetical protein
MTEEEFKKADKEGKIENVSRPEEQRPAETPADLRQFLDVLTALRIPHRALSATPTFAPRNFIEQIQFVSPSTVCFNIDNAWVCLGGSVSAKAYKNSPPSISDITWTKVTIDTLSFGSGITFDSGNNRFTATAAGKYLVSAQVWYNQPVDGGLYRAAIYKNGSIYSGTAKNSGSTHPVSPHICDIVDLAVSDYVELYTFHNSGVSKNISAGADLTFLSIAQV